MAVPLVSMDLFALATVPTGPDEAREPPPTNFYTLRDNLRWIELKVRDAGLPVEEATDRYGRRRYNLAAVDAWMKDGKPSKRVDRVATLEQRVAELERRLDEMQRRSDEEGTGYDPEDAA
jgi:DNA-binding transcriptional MerR regulator